MRLSPAALRYLDPTVGAPLGFGPLPRVAASDVFSRTAARPPALLEIIAALPPETQTGVRELLARLEQHHLPTFAHGVRVANVAMRLARAVGLSHAETARVGLAGLMHDIGKLAVPARLLDKVDLLSEADRTTLRAHAAHTHALLGGIPLPDALAQVRAIAADHHERLDGSGYPHGKRAAELPLTSRVLAVADVYDALTDGTRKYRRADGARAALQEVRKQSPHRLDARVVAALSASII